MKRILNRYFLLTVFLLIPFLLILLTTHVRADSENNYFEFGFQHRVRFIDFEDIIDYNEYVDDHNQFYRFRTRLWGKFVRNNLEVKLQLTNEFRHYNEPDKDNNFDEIFIDLCYLKFDKIFDSDWSIRVGRQNFIKGDGFFLFDGSPLDGSRSIYFNSLILKRDFRFSNLELFAISNPAKDEYLPRIDDVDKPLIELDEEALGAYFTGKLPFDIALEATYMFKTETSTYDESSPVFKPKRSMHIFGGYLSIPVGKSNLFLCELGVEYGEEDPDRTISAWAGHATWKHTFNTSMKPALKLTAGAFSG
ncbi:hypothetical protein K8T06_11255, partial [bacterium]|nr:hypothetical protein [bacterium]